MAASASSSSSGSALMSAADALAAFSESAEANVWVAACEGRMDALEAHLARGTAPDVADENGYTPLCVESTSCSWLKRAYGLG